MSGSLIPNGKQQYLDANGAPLAGGKVYYYIPYTTTAKNTWQDINLTILNTNPIILDSAGECIAWGSGAYRQQVYDVNDNLIWDQYTYGISPAGSNFISQEEVQTATQGQVVFTLSTITYVPGINSLVVFVNGSKQVTGTNYTETAGNTVTFVTGLNAGDVVDFYASLPASAQNMSNALNVAYVPPFPASATTNVQAKLSQTVSFQDFGAIGNGTNDDTAAVQAAINYACANKKSISAYGGFLISSTINFPSNTVGCKIIGQNRNTYFKYTNISGSNGALFATLSTSEVEISNVSLIGPGSQYATTAISCQTSNSSVGVYYCKFSDLTIEGFQYGMSVNGLCNSTFTNISMGLSKSGLFSGTDQQATPLIGISLGTTLEECVYNALSIFATQCCIQQATLSQLIEGQYFTNCTFDLSFNDGKNSNQSCIYFESGQDIVFTSCWFTNSKKYSSTTGPYSDYLVRVAYNAGSINAPLVALKFVNNTFVGNSMSIQFGNNTPQVREIEFVGNVIRLQAQLGKITIGGYAIGFTFSSNVIDFYGDSVTIGSVPMYNLSSEIINVSNIQSYTFVGNSFAGILPINNATTYIIVGGSSNGLFSDNVFPTQNSLSSGNDIVDNGSNTNVVVIGWQQSQLRQLNYIIPAATYSSSNTSIASITTNLTKPRMAIVEVNLTLINETVGGFIAINQGNSIDQIISVPNTGSNINIQITRTILVSGVVTLTWYSGTSFTVGANSSQFKVTFI